MCSAHIEQGDICTIDILASSPRAIEVETTTSTSVAVDTFLPQVVIGQIALNKERTALDQLGI